MKEHAMYLMSADLTQVHARLARKFNAAVAESNMHLPRKEDDAGLNPARSPRSDDAAE